MNETKTRKFPNWTKGELILAGSFSYDISKTRFFERGELHENENRSEEEREKDEDKRRKKKTEIRKRVSAMALSFPFINNGFVWLWNAIKKGIKS